MNTTVKFISKQELPHASHFGKTDVKKLLSDKSPFAVKELYGAIRTRLMFSKKSEKCPVFAMVSYIPGDGKTLTCLNVAISFARLGKKVLIIDGDMRNPTLHKFFGLYSTGGLSEILAGFSEEVNFKSTNIPNLTVLTSGETPPSPSELMNSEQMDKLLALVREHFDYVFIDTPPLGLTIDATILAQKITGYVIIARSGKSHIPNIKTAISQLTQLGGKITGFILNDPDGKLQKLNTKYSGRYYHRYMSNYQYGSERKVESPKK